MANASIYQISDGLSSSKENTGVRTYTRVYRVILKDLLVTDNPEYIALNHESIPDIADKHPNDGNCRVVSKKATYAGNNEDCDWYEVTIEYSNEYTSSSSTTTTTDNAIDTSPSITWTVKPFETIADRTIPDRNGNQWLIASSAGEPLIPPATIEKYNMILRLSRNLISFNPTGYYQSIGKVNSVPITIGGNQFSQPVTMTINNYCARLVNFSAEFHSNVSADTAINYWAVSVEFECRPDTWELNLLDQGTYWKNNNGRICPFYDQNGSIVTDKTHTLNGYGLPLGDTDGDGIIDTPDMPPVFLSYAVYDTWNFTELVNVMVYN